MKKFFLMIALLCAVLPATAQQPAPAEEEVADKAEPKFFIWGLLVRAVASEAFSMFGKWLISRISDSAQTGKMPLQQGTPNALASGEMLAAPPATVEGKPDVALKLENGQVNFQGVHIAVAVLDKADRQLKLRPLKAGFKTGERFKLRVLSTFNGQLQIDNINPLGVRRQIYPAAGGTVVSLQAGVDTLIPSGLDEYFEFARTTGEEQLVITLQDTRASRETASRSRVYVQNEAYGSNFLQQVGSNSYAVISESVRFSHHQ